MRRSAFTAAKAGDAGFWHSLLDIAPPDEEQLPLFPVLRSRGGAQSDLGKELFDGGPPIGVQARLGLIVPGRPRVVLRAMIAIALGWLPLAILAAIQGATRGDGSFGAFLSDYGVLARSLVAAPVLIAAEAIAIPRLSEIARHFRDARLVRESDLGRFHYAIVSTMRLRDSTLIETAGFVLAFAIIFAISLSVPGQLLPRWHYAGRGLSAAGWWHMLVSLPLLIVLLLGWLWRVALWARFLWLMSRLDLHLIPSHPDGAAGLKFVDLSLFALSTVAFAVGAIAAGTAANQIAHQHITLLSLRYVLLTYVGIVLAIFAAPLLVFIGKLVATTRRGVLEYGALARALGLQMETRWLHKRMTTQALGANDFSATTDLNSIVANVYGMSIVPIGLRNLAVLAIATLLPFVPVLLMSVSAEVIFRKLAGLVL